MRCTARTASRLCDGSRNCCARSTTSRMHRRRPACGSSRGTPGVAKRQAREERGLRRSLGFDASSIESWHEWLDGHGTRLDASLMALAGDDLIGMCVNAHYPDDEELLGRRDGWIESIGVLGAWRGRGVASALIARLAASVRRHAWSPMPRSASTRTTQPAPPGSTADSVPSR